MKGARFIMMEMPSIRKNFLYHTLYQILAMLAPLITTPYVSRVLDADGIGIYSYTNSLVTYFTLFAALGVLSYGNREIAQHRENQDEISRLFWEIELLIVITTSITLGVWLILVLLNTQYKIYLLILSIQIISVMFDISWFFGGLEFYTYIVKKNAICKLISIILTFVLVREKSDLWLYSLIMVASAAAGNITMWFYLPKFIVKPQWHNLDIKRHFYQTIIYFIPTIATSIYTVLDKTLIGILTQNEFENGYYEQATKIISMAKAVTFTSLNSVMGSRVSYLFSCNKIDEVREKIKISLNYILTIGIGIMFGIFGVSKWFVPQFFGDGYESVIYLLILFSPIIVIIGISNCAGSLYYIPAGLRIKSTRFILFGSCVNFFLNLLLIPRWDSYGAATASLFAEIIITVLYVHFSSGYFTFSMIFKMSWKRILAGTIMMILILFIGIVSKTSIFSIVTQVLIGLMIYGMLLIFMKDEFVMDIISKMRNAIQKQKR